MEVSWVRSAAAHDKATGAHHEVRAPAAHGQQSSRQPQRIRKITVRHSQSSRKSGVLHMGRGRIFRISMFWNDRQIFRTLNNRRKMSGGAQHLFGSLSKFGKFASNCKTMGNPEKKHVQHPSPPTTRRMQMVCMHITRMWPWPLVWP